MSYRGPYVSEVTFVGNDRAIEDCVAASGIDLARAAGVDAPATAKEREALRVDAGDTHGGMDLAHLRNGMSKRYAVLPAYVQSLDGIRSALSTGYALVILGWLDATPRRIWCQNSGNVYHAMFWNAGDSATSVHVANPLAPAGHPGFEVPLQVALDFASSSNGRGGIARGIYALSLREATAQSGPAQGGDVLKISDAIVRTFDIPVGVDILDSSAAKLGTTSVASTGLVSPFVVEIGPAHYLAFTTTSGGVQQLGLIHLPDAQNVRAVVTNPTDTTPFSQFDLDNAKASGYESARQKAIKAAEAI